MALYSTDKAVGLARDLSDRLTLRLSGSSTIDTVRQTQDASGWPMLILSNGGVETAGSAVIGIRIKNIDVSASDIFGNSTLPFAPHQTEVAYELTAGGAPEPSIPDLALAMFEVTKMGTVVVQETIANGSAVTESNMNSATVVQTLRDIDWSNKGNV